MEKETYAKMISLSGKHEGFGSARSFENGKDPLRLSSAFRAGVLELHDFLGEMKQRLDREEAKIRLEDPDRRLLEEDVLHPAEEILTRSLERFILRMNQIVSCFTPEEHLVHRSYFQQHLHPFLLLSPFVKRAYSKPLGYPGDYEMMNMLYGSHDRGDSLFARLINRYCCQVTAARSVVKRLPYMLEKIGRTIDQVSHNKESVAFTSLGCGPAREIQELIRIKPMSDPCRVTLIDTEQEALKHCHAEIGKVKEAAQSGISVSFVNRSLHQLILDPYAPYQLGNQDLIYATGLFDYLPTHIAKRLIQKLYRLLSEGGELIIGNLSGANDARYFMEYGAEWYVLYRSPLEMMQLAEGLPSPLHVEVDEEEGGAQLYLVIKRWKVSEAPLYRWQEAAPRSYGKN